MKRRSKLHIPFSCLILKYVTGNTHLHSRHLDLTCSWSAEKDNGRITGTGRFGKLNQTEGNATECGNCDTQKR